MNFCSSSFFAFLPHFEHPAPTHFLIMPSHGYKADLMLVCVHLPLGHQLTTRLWGHESTFGQHCLSFSPSVATRATLFSASVRMWRMTVDRHGAGGLSVLLRVPQKTVDTYFNSAGGGAHRHLGGSLNPRRGGRKPLPARRAPRSSLGQNLTH